MKKIISCATAAAIILAVSGCSVRDFDENLNEQATIETTEITTDDIDKILSEETTISAENTSEIPKITTEEVKSIEELSSAVGNKSSISMSLNENGGLDIVRRSRNNTSPMGEDGTWTIFVYLCGTDLESENGMSSMDIEEMLSASGSDKVKFVIQTGGTSYWQNNVVDSTKLQRFLITGGQMYFQEELPSANMGESQTLSSFLSWGIENHAAENMGVIFWNHGGGSITGVCFDELNDFDSLSLREIDAALLSVYDKMTDNFEFIGFDACLMGTIEAANILATYSDYMYGSQEFELGFGWDYTAIGNYLAENPNADGLSLGKTVADSYYKCCEKIGQGNIATLSVIDLSQINNVITSFNAYAEDIYSSSDNNAVLTEIVRNIENADNYGGNNKSVGYTNMVDLVGIVNAGTAYSDNSNAVIDAIKKAVPYKVNGSDHYNACGLSTYYPLSLQGSSELSVFGKIAISPYYLSLVDKIAYGSYSGGNTDGYSNDDLLDIWGLFDYLFSDEYDDYYYDSSLGSDYWDYADYWEPTGESPLISFEHEPQFDEDGHYFFQLTEEALWNTCSVEASVFLISEDMVDIIDLGMSVDIIYNWQSGYFSDNFDGYWFCLPDGQALAVYMVGEYDGYDIYTSPVMLNGKETNLRITHHYSEDYVTIDGAWDGVDEYGCVAREVIELCAGDEILPLYYAYAIDSLEEYYYYGWETYIYDGNPEIYFNLLPNGEYLYGFSINDIYGDYYITDYISFTVDGDEIFYDDLQ